MATVKNVIALFDALYLKGRASFEDDTKIALLNLAKEEVWKILVGSQAQQNWFVDQSQSALPGQNDHFGLLAVNQREYVLPPNFHQMRVVEVVTTGKEHIKIDKSKIDSGGFRQQRASVASFQDQASYDIIGTAPGQMMFALFPPSALDLKLWYARHPVAWDAKTDLVDEFPANMHGFIAEWAVQRAALGVGDHKFVGFTKEWSERLERTLTTYDRDTSGVSTAEEFVA